MRCPYCRSANDKVVNSRTCQDGESIRRRRECLDCGKRFTTFEYIHAYGFPAAVGFRREMANRLGPPVSRRVVTPNLPPAFVLRWMKGGSREGSRRRGPKGSAGREGGQR